MAEKMSLLEVKQSPLVETPIPTTHKDTILDAAFDFSGKRLATCSADQHVCVWDTNREGEWECTAKFLAHNGPIWRLEWSHPQFGQLLATCSFDCCVNIWQENTKVESSGKHTLRWEKEATRLDSQSSVNDVRFGPHYWGLQFASCAKNGYVRVYEAKDIMRLNDWTLSHEFHALNEASCLSWSQASLYPPLIAVGSDEKGAGSVRHLGVYQLHRSSNTWKSIIDDQTETMFRKVNDVCFANWMGRSYHSLAVGGNGLFVVQIRPAKPNLSSSESDYHYKFTQIPLREPDRQVEVWRVDWNITGDMLIASSNDRRVLVWKQSGVSSFEIVRELVATQDSYNPTAINPELQSGLAVAGEDAPQETGTT